MNILILGAGYAGLRAALEISQLREDGLCPAVEVTLVDCQPYHQLVVLLHLVATAAATSHEATLPLDSIIRGRGIRLRQGEIAAIATAQQQVRLANGELIPYDRLVVALGATTSYHNVPGAREHTLPMRTYNEAVAVREQVLGCFERARTVTDPSERRRLMTIAIVGGGYTGIQLAGELGSWLPKLAASHGLPPEEVRIALLDRTQHLLTDMGLWASSEAERALDSLRVSLYLNTTVARVEPGLLILDETRRLRAGTLVWAGGIVAPALLAESGLPTGANGRVVVDRFLRALVAKPHIIYAIGDCALVEGKHGEGLAATASFAMRQGDYIAHQIANELQGEPMEPYEPSYLGEIVSLGPGRGVGKPLGVPVSGLPAAMLKRTIEEWYLTTLEPGSVGAIL